MENSSPSTEMTHFMIVLYRLITNGARLSNIGGQIKLNRKLKMLFNRRVEIERELAALESFRKTLQLQRFKRQLAGELSFVKRQISILQTDEAVEENLKLQKTRLANKNRSEKMKRTWRYLRSIQQNYFPDKGLRELRSLFKKQRHGLETDVSDVVWHNPSP